MLGYVTIGSCDDPVTALRKLHWSLVPEFLVLNGEDSKDRLRSYTVVLSEAEMGHIEKLCRVAVGARKPKRTKATARTISKRRSTPAKKMNRASAKEALPMGRLF